MGQKALRVAMVALAVAGAAACATAPKPKTRAQIEMAPRICSDFTVSLYFERNSAKVTREAQDVLATAQHLARGCQVKDVEVVGLADSAGAPDANLELSKRRGRAVTAALQRAGFEPETVTVSAVGEAGAQTGLGVAPLRRRADVNIHLVKTP